MNYPLRVNNSRDQNYLLMGEGLERFRFFRGFPHNSIDNKTDNIFKMQPSIGGYNSQEKRIDKNNYINPLSSNSGIVTLAPPQHYNDQVTQSAIINGLVDAPVNHKINALIDASLPQGINPIAITGSHLKSQ